MPAAFSISRQSCRSQMGTFDKQSRLLFPQNLSILYSALQCGRPRDSRGTGGACNENLEEMELLKQQEFGEREEKEAGRADECRLWGQKGRKWHVIHWG